MLINFHRKLNFEDLFPPMCFGDGAYIIPGQLRECLQKLEIESSDDIVARILRKWVRISTLIRPD